MMDGLLNTIRREVTRMMSRLGFPKCGTVTAYDPKTYSVKVMLHPEEVETGWLPVRTPWSGNGWGMFCPPTPGDEVTVNFQEGGKQAGFVTMRAFGDRFRPLPVPSGELWVVHKSGAAFTLTNDGRATIRDGYGSYFTLNDDGTADSNFEGNVAFNCPRIDYSAIVNAQEYYGKGVPPVADGQYCTGQGLSQDGYITVRGGIIAAIQEAS